MMNPNQSTNFGTNGAVFGSTIGTNVPELLNNEITFGSTIGTNVPELLNKQIQQQKRFSVTYSTIFVEGYQHFMSFVGIYNTNHGLIAFADSKSTLINEPGAAHDTKRGLINKIFSNSHFICTYHGANALRCNDTAVFIEDYFRDHMGDKTAPVFFEELSALVKNKTYSLPSPLGSAVPAAVYFIVGTYIPEISKYALYRQTLSADGTLSTNDYTTNTVALFGGFSAYVDMIAAAPHYSDVPIDKYEQTVKRRAELLIDYVDTFGIYNPAGHPIVTKVFSSVD